MDAFTVVAEFRARPGHEAALRSALLAMLAPSRAEEGCLNYDLHEGTDDQGLLFFHENWASAEHHRVHLGTAHVRNLLALTPDLIAEPIRELKGRRIEQAGP